MRDSLKSIKWLIIAGSLALLIVDVCVQIWFILVLMQYRNWIEESKQQTGPSNDQIYGGGYVGYI